jgi:hypothetical protein
MSTESDILRALQQGVTAAVAASSTPTLPVAYIDKVFNTPEDGKWLEIVQIPNNRNGDFWNQEKNHQGLLRLILHWPKDGSGPYAPRDVIGSIGDYFHNGRLLQGVQIYEKADFTGSIPLDAENLYPVSIRYQSYRS